MTSYFESQFSRWRDQPDTLLDGLGRPWKRPTTGERLQYAVYPGSFNPLHTGHRAIAEHVETRFQVPVFFELSVHNADKRSISAREIHRRCEQFSAPQKIVLSQAPLFSEKARLFPMSYLILGADTWIRVQDPKYYAGRFQDAMRSFVENQIHFIVFGRLVGETFVSQKQFPAPKLLARHVTFIGEQEFRVDLSSTEIRKSSS